MYIYTCGSHRDLGGQARNDINTYLHFGQCPKLQSLINVTKREGSRKV